MTAFDAKVRIGEAAIQLNRENEDELATEAELVLGVLTVAQVGPNQVLPIPFGTIRIPLDKSSVVTLSEQFAKAAEQMKDRPNIEIASSLAGVDQAVAAQQDLRS